ncbi:MAG: hypothetical protein ABSG78_13315 [Verrucomicrobiota bacterium]
MFSRPQVSRKHFAHPLSALVGAAITGLCIVAYPAFAQNWTLTSAPNENWTSVACSYDGVRIVAATVASGIYVSTNGGGTWTNSSAPALPWSSVASSADGLKLAATAGYYGPSGPIYTSTNGGSTWTQTSAPTEFWRAVACSADGTKLTAVSYAGPYDVYVSGNSGASWRAVSTAVSAWFGVAASTNGTKLVALDWFGGIYTSSDSGSTWRLTSAPSPQYWIWVASSDDGTKLAAVVLGGGIYTSSDSGATWELTTAPTDEWFSVASSADGSRLVAVSEMGGVSVSTDQGATWSSAGAPNENWSFVASSADGSQVIAVAAGGGIYTWNAGPAQPELPQFITQPASQTAPGGAKVTLSAVEYSLTSLSYQWQFNGADLPDATNAVLTLNHVGLTNSGSYALLVTNNIGGALSSNAVLTVVPLVIDAQPKSIAGPVLAGTSVTFYFNVWSTVPLSYQWLFNGTNLPGATYANLQIINVTPLNSGAYSVLISNSFGSVLSSNAMLPTVLPAFVTTLPATGISASGVTLNGLVTPGPKGSAVWFEWGVDTNYGNSTATNTFSPGDNALACSSLLRGLSANIIYHCRLDAGNVYGSDLSKSRVWVRR